MEITTDQINDLHMNLDMAGDDFEFRAYSGRAMYGSECLALVTDANPWQIMRTLHEYRDSLTDPYDVGESSDPEMTALLTYLIETDPSQDSMGHGSVYYWQSIKIAEEEN